MKKYLVLPCILLGLFAQAQKKPAAKKTTAPAKTASASGLKSQTDSMSYAIGMSVANFYSQMGIKNINAAQLTRAVNDVFARRELALTDAQAQTCLMEVQSNIARQGAEPNIKAGEQFLAENKKKAGVKTTASGLQYLVLREGTGIRPAAADTVEVNYAGTLIDGTEFDNSYKRGQSISFPLNQVIRGWTEGLQLMSTGSKYRLFIPYQLGYGMNGAGSAIPGGSALIFDVELLNVKKSSAPTH